MGQCFQDIGLTKWINVVGKQCPNNTHLTKENFDECIRDYLEAVVGFSNISTQLICWLCATKKPAFMPMHEFMRHQVQLFSYLDGGHLCWTMELPTAQEKCKQSCLAQPKTHQYKFAETNKSVPMDPLGLWPFSSSVRLPTKQPASLTSSRRRSSQKRRRQLIFLLLTAMIQTTSSIVARTATTIKATNAIATNNNMTVAIKTINAPITLVAKSWTTRKSPTKMKMNANVITSRRRKMRSCTIISPLCWVWTLHPEKESLPFKVSFLLTLPFLLSLKQRQQDQCKPSCLPWWLQAKRLPQVQVFILWGRQQRMHPASWKKQYCFCHLCRSKGSEKQACSQIGNCASRATSLCSPLCLHSR